MLKSFKHFFDTAPSQPLYGCYTGPMLKRNLSMRTTFLGVIFRTRMEERNDLFPLNLYRDIFSPRTAV